MKFYGEMRVQGGGPLDGSRFDALAYALAGIEESDPAIESVDLTSSLAQGWVTASMTISEENLELAVAKLIAAVRAAIYPHGDHAGGWQFLTETAGLSVHPMTDRAGMSCTRPAGTAAGGTRPAGYPARWQRSRRPTPPDGSAAGGTPPDGSRAGGARPMAPAAPDPAPPPAACTARAAAPAAGASPAGCPRPVSRLWLAWRQERAQQAWDRCATVTNSVRPMARLLSS